MPFVYAFIRLSDPVVYTTIKRQFLRTCHRQEEASESSSSKSNDESDELKDSINGFLTSSLNVELVYTILKGIVSIVT